MKEQNNNKKKGFSLVELIVVIAIMVVLVAVLAPVFTKYVEQSRRATDVQNAASISEAILIGIADGSDENHIESDEVTAFAANTVDSINTVPEVQGNVVEGGAFYYHYDSSNNTCAVYVSTSSTTVNEDLNLATATGATAYKDYKPSK